MKCPDKHVTNRLSTHLKVLSMTVSSLMLAPSLGNASDIELYRSATAGGANVMLVFDNSGSMDARSIGVDYKSDGVSIGTQRGNYYCAQGGKAVWTQSKNFSETIYNDDGSATTAAISYPVTYCSINGKIYYDRISRLKIALMPLLANPKKSFGDGVDFSKYKIGLVNFFYTDMNTGGGQISYPAKDFNLTNRTAMLNIIKNLKAETNTPSAHAYAEAGAYMLGTSTKYANTGTYASVKQDSIYSGFAKAHANAISGDNYISPLTAPTSASDQQCDGNGIYFLTDGEPNNVQGTSAIDLMNAALDKVSPIADPANTKLSVGTDATCDTTFLDGNFDSGTTNRSGWQCMGKFAQQLRSTNNPMGREIITGTAGFGKVFESLENIDTCDSTSADASNLCRLGKKGEGFGEGGFYYVEEPKELANSIMSFIADVGNKNIPAISTGTMAVPLDALNTQQSRGYAYTPILDPKPGTTTLWDGNLKKYFIRNSTVTSDTTGTNAVFLDKTGRFSTSTSDIWNTINDTSRADAQRPDSASPQVGGAYQQVFEKTNNDRNLWVNVNGTLTNIRVDATTKKPEGLTALKPELRQDLVKPDTGDDTRAPIITGILNRILMFMGYPAQAAADIDDTTVLTGERSNKDKNIGGVIHSIPQLVTYGVTLNEDGSFDVDTRKDSVLYGSMDGALHLVDDKTGQEQFTFIPKEILDLQSGALVKGGTTEESQLPYGVDAPWNVYTNYALKTSTGTKTSTQYAAKQVFASGGLRMGGSTYYGLNISDANTPSMVYSVGSNYANVLQGKATTLQGMRNGTYGTTDEQKAFARMGQSWAKPSVGFVKVNGKKVMVNFLAGGYDTCYEDAAFTLKTTGDNVSCATKTQAQGNAVYMVRVGEEKGGEESKDQTGTYTDTTIDTSADNGKLLWWASYGASKSETNNNTTRTTALQKSEHTDMTNSIVTEIRTLDRNYDGFTDHIYYADLGGRVWRADINNNKDTDTFRVDRVVKLLDVSAEASNTDAPPRFYERPLLTVTNEVVDGEAMGQITVGTGNRSLPISEQRSTADAIYSFIDREVGKRSLFCYQSDEDCKTNGSDNTLTQAIQTKNLTKANLQVLQFAPTDAAIKSNMKKAVNDTDFRHGWYYVMDKWNTITGKGTTLKASATVENNVKGLKMFNEPDAQAGLLFVSVFNPNVNLMEGGCSATVQGATQRMLMCLPFGNCGNSDYKAADGVDIFSTRSVGVAGAGIIDNIITQNKPGTKKSLYGALQLHCTGDECDKNLFGKDSIFGEDTINSAGVQRDKLINPRLWLEK